MITRQGINCRLCGAVSGLLLGLPNLIGQLAPLQLLAFIPVFHCVVKSRFKTSQLLACGFYLALGFTLPQVICLLLPVPLTVILLLLYIIMMMILVYGASRILRHTGILNCLAFAAFAVVLDWANYTAVPMWGTAQSIVRSWSAYPKIIAFTSITGMGGIVFVLVALQSLEVSYILCPKLRKHIIITIVTITAVFGALDMIALKGRPKQNLKVAAVGWTSSAQWNQYDPQKKDGFENLFAKPVTSAAAQGAKLVVSPEMGFYVDLYDRKQWIGMIKKLAADNNVYLAVGYIDARINQNRMLFVNCNGEVLKEYSKTYLTPFESFDRGNGMPKTIDIEGIRVGGMICQDDNFTSISRRYGNVSAGIVAVPTLDWGTVRYPHMQNSIHRAVESRYAIVRASYDGISAIITPRGKVIASFDHIEKGPGSIIADVEIYSQSTIFNQFGNWFVMLNGAFYTIYAIVKKYQRYFTLRKHLPAA